MFFLNFNKRTISLTLYLLMLASPCLVVAQNFTLIGLCRDLFISKTATSTVWNDKSYFEFTLEASFSSLREKADGGNWNGEDWDNVDTEKLETGFLSVGNVRVPILLRARGMSSLQTGEADFPKLKVKIADDSSRDQLNSTALSGINSFRLNTHVSDFENLKDPKLVRTEMGRLRSEVSPLRESLAYALAVDLDLLVPKTRLAQITYVDLPLSKKELNLKYNMPNGRRTKKALMIESSKAIKKRLNATEVTLDDLQNFAIWPLDSVEGAVFHLFHKLIGNDDLGLQIYEKTKTPTERNRPLFNTELYRLPNGKIRPLIYDLDLSTFVSGFELLNPVFSKNLEFGLNGNSQSIVAYKLFALRQKIPHDILKKAIEFMKLRQSKLTETVEAALARNQIDLDGFNNAKLHIELFFNTIDQVMNTTVLGSPGVAFYRDIEGQVSGLKRDIVIDADAYLRLGTPIKILGKEKNLYKVAIADPFWDVEYSEDGLKPDQPATVGYVSQDIKIVPFLNDDQIGVNDSRDM